MRANDRGNPEVLRGQPAPPCAAWYQLARPIQRGPRASLSAPQPQCWLGNHKRQGKTPGIEPPA